MITWGWSGLSHDAALAVFVDDKLVYASHSERFSRIKNDRRLNQAVVNEALQYGFPDEVHFYERPLLKKTRHALDGQYAKIISESPRNHMAHFGVDKRPITHSHHSSHAAAGFYTSPFVEALVVCIDAIGEWETLTLWKARGKKMEKLYNLKYPHSLGLWYSAMTQRVGLKPQEHEYILMGMAAFGHSDRLYASMKEDFFGKKKAAPIEGLHFKMNLHRGCLGWRPELNSTQDYFDIAAATQRIYEETFNEILEKALKLFPSKNLVLMGGCALNCVANSLAWKLFDRVWILPSPGDAGSSIGSVLDAKREFIGFPSAFLGHEIAGDYPCDDLINELITHKIVGVAKGRAEFGPRALGNRSLLADPRDLEIKDRLNSFKQRESFRPFAPVILEEHLHEYFEVPPNLDCRFMQYTLRCLKPDAIPAAVHLDGTSRVQSVSKRDHSGLHKSIKLWYERTGIPVLINTSLNIKGEPLVNTQQDAEKWEKAYHVKVF